MATIFMKIETRELNANTTQTFLELDRIEAFLILRQLLTVMTDPKLDVQAPHMVTWSQETVEQRQDLYISIRGYANGYANIKTS